MLYDAIEVNGQGIQYVILTKAHDKSNQNYSIEPI